MNLMFKLPKPILSPRQKECSTFGEVERFSKKIGFPVVLKIFGTSIHKTEVGGVSPFVCESFLEDEFIRLKELSKRFGNGKVIVQERIDGEEAILGYKLDDQFGPLIVFGLGGTNAESINDVSHRICPVSVKDAEEMLEELSGKKVFLESRKWGNLKSLISRGIASFSKAVLNSGLKSIDINPIVVNSYGCYAVDIRCVA